MHVTREANMPATAWSHDAGSSSSSQTGRGGGGGRATVPRSLHRLFMTGALLGAVLWIDFVSGEVRDHIYWALPPLLLRVRADIIGRARINI